VRPVSDAALTPPEEAPTRTHYEGLPLKDWAWVLTVVLVILVASGRAIF
jgi:hypothetical protein